MLTQHNRNRWQALLLFERIAELRHLAIVRDDVIAADKVCRAALCTEDGELENATMFCISAERVLIRHHRCQQWRQSPEGMRMHARLCELRDAEYRACCSIWDENGVMVRKLPFDGARVERLINEAISSYENDERDRAERLCRMAARAMRSAAP